MSKNCPRCRLTNPAEAQICDCGYEFDTGKMGDPLDPADRESLSPFEKLACAFGYGIWVYLQYKGVRRRKASEALRYTLIFVPIWGGVFFLQRFIH